MVLITIEPSPTNYNKTYTGWLTKYIPNLTMNIELIHNSHNSNLLKDNYTFRNEYLGE